MAPAAGHMIEESNPRFCATGNGGLCNVTSRNKAGDAELESLSAGNAKGIFLHKRTLGTMLSGTGKCSQPTKITKKTQNKQKKSAAKQSCWNFSLV